MRFSTRNHSKRFSRKIFSCNFRGNCCHGNRNGALSVMLAVDLCFVIDRKQKRQFFMSIRNRTATTSRLGHRLTSLDRARLFRRARRTADFNQAPVNVKACKSISTPESDKLDARHWASTIKENFDVVSGRPTLTVNALVAKSHGNAKKSRRKSVELLPKIFPETTN